MECLAIENRIRDFHLAAVEHLTDGGVRTPSLKEHKLTGRGNAVQVFPSPPPSRDTAARHPNAADRSFIPGLKVRFIKVSLATVKRTLAIPAREQ